MLFISWVCGRCTLVTPISDPHCSFSQVGAFSRAARFCSACKPRNPEDWGQPLNNDPREIMDKYPNFPEECPRWPLRRSLVHQSPSWLQVWPTYSGPFLSFLSPSSVPYSCSYASLWDHLLHLRPSFSVCFFMVQTKISVTSRAQGESVMIPAGRKHSRCGADRYHDVEVYNSIWIR